MNLRTNTNHPQCTDNTAGDLLFREKRKNTNCDRICGGTSRMLHGLHQPFPIQETDFPEGALHAAVRFVQMPENGEKTL